MRQYMVILFIAIAFTLSFSCKEATELEPVQTTEPDINAVVEVDEYPAPTNQVNPVYPEEARKNHIQGTVWIKALISAEGKVKKAVVVERKDGSPDLETAALMATFQWTFTPAKKNGAPLDTWVMIPFRFALK